MVVEEGISQMSESRRWLLSFYNVTTVVASSFPGVLHILNANLLS